MSGFQRKFDQAVWNTVSGIAAGHIMSYGEVARAAGFPRHARMVGKALGRSNPALPWHRVVRSDRMLAFPVDSKAYNEQKELLQKEGVTIINGKVTAPESNVTANLDKLLWGPPDNSP